MYSYTQFKKWHGYQRKGDFSLLITSEISEAKKAWTVQQVFIWLHLLKSYGCTTQKDFFCVWRRCNSSDRTKKIILLCSSRNGWGSYDWPPLYSEKVSCFNDVSIWCQRKMTQNAPYCFCPAHYPFYFLICKRSNAASDALVKAFNFSHSLQCGPKFFITHISHQSLNLLRAPSYRLKTYVVTLDESEMCWWPVASAMFVNATCRREKCIPSRKSSVCYLLLHNWR